MQWSLIRIYQICYLSSAAVATARAVEPIDVYSHEWHPHAVRIDKAIHN